MIIEGEMLENGVEQYDIYQTAYSPPQGYRKSFYRLQFRWDDNCKIYKAKMFYFYEHKQQSCFDYGLEDESLDDLKARLFDKVFWNVKKTMKVLDCYRYEVDPPIWCKPQI